MRPAIPQTICCILLLVIFYPVFFADYAYTDEAHQLWYNDDNSNFIMFFEQGRGLTGLIIKKLFSTFTTISELKWIRVISFTGWVLTVIIWNVVLNSWKRIFHLNDHWAFFLHIFLPCSISVAIAIGWGSCVELFLAFMLGLLSGHVLFISTYNKRGTGSTLLSLLAAVILALASLSLYQPMFGAFLLPFFWHHMNNRFKKVDRLTYVGIGFYLAIHALYFILFKYTLVLYGIEAGARTALSVNPLRKLSFFFSQPLAQAFSFNFLYNLHSIFSQAFYPLVFAAWLFSVFAWEREQKLLYKFAYVGRVLLLMMLIYVAVLLPKENFASYRTMLCLNAAGTLLLTDGMYRLTQHSKFKNVIPYLAAGLIAIVAWCNYNLNFVQPLKKEYQALHTYFRQHYTSSVTTIYFVRPKDDLFTTLYHQQLYKDEFGLPSGHKDWTPEPLVKQMIFEATGNREKARQTTVVNLAFEERENAKAGPGALIMDEAQIMLQ